MQRVIVIARLKEGARTRALELLESEPPFDLADTDFERHAVYVSEGEVAFFFEGPDAMWRLDDLVSDFFHPALRLAIEEWRPLIEGEPRVATEAFFWERRETAGGS